MRKFYFTPYQAGREACPTAVPCPTLQLGLRCDSNPLRLGGRRGNGLAVATKGGNMERDGKRDTLPCLFPRPANCNTARQVGNICTKPRSIFGWLDDHQILNHCFRSSLVSPACFRILSISGG